MHVLTPQAIRLPTLPAILPTHADGALPVLIERQALSDLPVGAGELSGLSALLHLWNNRGTWLDAQLQRHGALLFRGFDISQQDTFQSLLGELKSSLMDYVDGNSPRTRLAGGVYTSTEYPREYEISMHNELSYAARWPARLFLACVIEPKDGGETPLVDSRNLLRALPKEITAEFRGKQVRYTRNLHSGLGIGKSWQATFETDSLPAVDAYAAKSGLKAQWSADGSLSLSNIRPATAFHPITREEVWFNQADQFHPSGLPDSIYRSMLEIYDGCEDRLPQNATFGDGTPIPIEYLDAIRKTTARERVLFPWRLGDLLMVDNMLAAHGRMPFTGPRRILVSMTGS